MSRRSLLASGLRPGDPLGLAERLGRESRDDLVRIAERLALGSGSEPTVLEVELPGGTVTRVDARLYPVAPAAGLALARVHEDSAGAEVEAGVS